MTPVAGATWSTVLAVVALTLLALAPWWSAAAGSVRRVVAVGSLTATAAREKGPSERVDLPVLVELVAAALRSGAAVPRALEASGDAVGGRDGVALRAVADALRLGSDWDTAWRAAPARLSALRGALRSSWVDGASAAATLRAARDEVLHARRTAARTAAGRLAVRLVLPLGVCFLPAFVLVGLAPVLIALGVDLMSG